MGAESKDKHYCVGVALAYLSSTGLIMFLVKRNAGAVL
jgi:hypothetical protein